MNVNKVVPSFLGPIFIAGNIYVYGINEVGFQGYSVWAGFVWYVPLIENWLLPVDIFRQTWLLYQYLLAALKRHESASDRQT
jgi:hypothetical protein